jgi:hypothetical protein
MKTSRLALAFALTSLVLAYASYAHGDLHGAMRGDSEHMSQCGAVVRAAHQAGCDDETSSR